MSACECVSVSLSAFTSGTFCVCLLPCYQGVRGKGRVGGMYLQAATSFIANGILIELTCRVHERRRLGVHNCESDVDIVHIYEHS